jgi:hypothetical protein
MGCLHYPNLANLTRSGSAVNRHGEFRPRRDPFFLHPSARVVSKDRCRIASAGAHGIASLPKVAPGRVAVARDVAEGSFEDEFVDVVGVVAL